MSAFKLALCQLSVSVDKNQNIKRAAEMVQQAAGDGARMIILPEMFNCPYRTSLFPQYAESIDNGETVIMLKETARKYKVYLVGGSIPEKENDRVYNTSLTFGPDGNLLGRYRKIHLYDVDLPGGPTIKESSTLGYGEELVVINTEFCGLGVVICFDVRYPELIRLLTLKGAQLIVIPAAFNNNTGPVHWEMTMRARAVDNQIFVAAASPARNPETGYVIHGHSIIVDPWGKILAEAGVGEEIIMADIDMKKLQDIRRRLPLLDLRRQDLYDLKWKK